MPPPFQILLFFLSLIALLSTTALYTYPLLFSCSYLSPPSSSSTNPHPPIRLLALADPQLEGSTSLPTGPYDATSSLLTFLTSPFRVSSLNDPLPLRRRLNAFLTKDIPLTFQILRKRLDLWGNDYYLGHIYTSLTGTGWTSGMRWSRGLGEKPTHVAVLGDLVGSQWIGGEELEERGRRFWGRVFRSGERVGDEMTDGVVDTVVGGRPGAESQGLWPWNRIINVVGNHDIGYAGDIDARAVERWERVFGPVNSAIRATLHLGDEKEQRDAAPELRIVNLNSLNLDVPVLDSDLQGRTYEFVNKVIKTARDVGDRTSATILLTHLPLYKEAGVCVDGPMIQFYEGERNGGVKEQNHLSPDSSRMILEALFGFSREAEHARGGRGRHGLILTGHDHEGCDVWHYLSPQADGQERVWMAKRWNETTAEERENEVGLREVTVRSMMGDFGGNAALVGAWFEPEKGGWTIEVRNCALGKQHWWWAVHVIDLISVGLWVGFGAFKVWKGRQRAEGGKQKMS